MTYFLIRARSRDNTTFAFSKKIEAGEDLAHIHNNTNNNGSPGVALLEALSVFFSPQHLHSTCARSFTFRQDNVVTKSVPSSGR